jgi:membrane protease YdiL (CAAX protease family)
LTHVPWSTGDVVRGVALAIAAIAFLAVGVLLYGVLRTPDEGLEVPDQLWLLVLQTGILVGSALLYSVRKYPGGLPILGFRRAVGGQPYMYAVGAWGAALIVAAAWSALMHWTGPDWLKTPDSASQLSEQFGASVVGLALVAVVWGPVGEEVFFRGFVLPGLVKRFGAPVGVVLSSGLFALFHIDVGMLVPTFLLGAAFAWIYLRTGSLWPAILAHGAQNALALWLVGVT